MKNKKRNNELKKIDKKGFRVFMGMAALSMCLMLGQNAWAAGVPAEAEGNMDAGNSYAVVDPSVGGNVYIWAQASIDRSALGGQTAAAFTDRGTTGARITVASNLGTRGFAGINLDPARGDLLGKSLEVKEKAEGSLKEGIIFGLAGASSSGKSVDGTQTVMDGQDAEETLTAVDGQEDGEELQEESEYADLAIAHVDKYVNVRSMPSTDGKILGKIYNGAVAHIIETAGEEDDWLHVTSGSVEGYIKAEYFIYGQDAAAVIDDYVTRYAVVTASRLNVRKETTTDSKRIGYLNQGEKAKIVENLGDWILVEYSKGQTGYVSAEYVEVTEEFVYAISIEEEQAEIARQKALEERRRQEEEEKRAKEAAEAAALAAAANAGAEGVAQETVQNAGTQEITPAAGYSDNQELRDSLVEYALQFVGNPYVNGGNSLTNGTDCSGFTKLIYGEYGYSLGRTPSSQLSSAGRSVNYEDIQKGDIICYSSNGGKSCTHVAIYIGDGMVVHAANSRKGICTQKAQYSTIVGVKNIID